MYFYSMRKGSAIFGIMYNAAAQKNGIHALLRDCRFLFVYNELGTLFS
jgi:hypothetical protein